MCTFLIIMETNMTTRMAKEDAFTLYQQLCDEVFGAGAVQIKQAPSNPVTGALRHLDDFNMFKMNFKERLKRLERRFRGTSSYPSLLEQVKLVADPKNWEGAFAELVAYDAMWNDQIITVMELDKTLNVAESFAGEMGYKATNEDGFLPDYGLYFDVKILADTVGGILKGIIDDAITNSGQVSHCDIRPEYPLDDDDEDYSGVNRKKLCNELTCFLKAHSSVTTGEKLFRSTVLPRLSYRILWGVGVNSTMGEYNPYRHAEATKHLVFKRYTKKIMKNEMFMLVLVRFPWYNNLISSFDDADQVYYRNLARRTFCGYCKDNTAMKVIVPQFGGQESVFDVSRNLAGIIFIDDNSIKEDSYTCNVVMNPNAKNTHPMAYPYLMSLVKKGDRRGLYVEIMWSRGGGML